MKTFKKNELKEKSEIENNNEKRKKDSKISHKKYLETEEYLCYN